ncbi:MAG: ATP-binding protein [Clostridia bacterium]|nr:ATP-binding protein [Clostridia bacterium]
MNIFESVLQQAMQPRAPNEGDYRDQEGFLVCGHCGGRKEFDLEILGKLRRVPCSCTCEQAAVEAERQADRLQRQKDRINNSVQWLREMGCLITPEATFSRNDGKSRKNTETLVRYAEKFDQAAEKNIGLMLYGETGAGKTFFAECIANRLAQDGKFVWMTKIQDVAAAMSAAYGEHRPEILRYIQEVDLLILDDFGTERGTPFMVEQAYGIINARYEARRPMIVTTNIDPATMEGEQDIQFKRLYERVMEVCIKHRIEGGTRRAAYAHDKALELKSILGLE